MKSLRRVSGSVLAVSVLLVQLAPAAGAAKVPHGRFGLGDSIMLSASDELADFGLDDINAEVGRQFSAGVPIVRRLASKGKLPRHVVVHLGTNGPVDPDDCDDLVGYATGRQIYLVNVRVPRSWEDDVNATLHACADRYARVHYLNWWKKSARHRRDWIADDGYHLTAEGQEAYAAWIDGKVDAVVRSLRTGR